MSRDAHAQYKNMSWGFFVGGNYWLEGENLQYYKQQDFFAAGGGQLATGETTPTATPYSHINPMFHFELSFKISDSFTWWFKSGLDVGIIRLTSDASITSTAGGGAGGAAIMLAVTAGPRVYFLTDEIRPFLEIGVRIPIPGILVFSASNSFIPQNVKTFPGIYGLFGCEFFVTRDTALSITAGYTRFILINFPGINSFDAKFGVLFYM